MFKFKAGDKVRRPSNEQTSWWQQICKLNNKNPLDVFEVSDLVPPLSGYVHIVGLSESTNPKNRPRFAQENFELVTLPENLRLQHAPWCHWIESRQTKKCSCGPAKIPLGDATYTGGSSDYYQVTITNTTTPNRPSYVAECNDIIEALGMNFAEGNAFKALWRRAAQRTLGLRKAGAKDDGLYDAEKVEFFGKRLVEMSKGKE